MYQPLQPARSAFVPIRQHRYHLWQWGPEPTAGQPLLVLLHGWMDVGASWQFVVDALGTPGGPAHGRAIVAPDWRGFGLTTGPATDSYWFPDYLADLDVLLAHLAGDQPVDLVGHSMGGNIATVYAGVRPQRVRRLVNLEGFGLPATQPSQAPARYAQWLDGLRSVARGELDLKPYADAAGVARRLTKTNPRLAPERADWLARHWAAPDAAGQWRVHGDPAHKVPSANLYRADEALALMAAITAPTLAVEADGDSLRGWWEGRYTLAEWHRRLEAVPDCRVAVVREAGHMLHHDQPEAVARLIADFIA